MENTNNRTIKDFSQTLDFGTVATSVPMQVIDVIITSSDMVSGYAKAFVNEVARVNPNRAKQVGLTQKEMLNYATYLLDARVRTVHDECPDWRMLKNLYIPVFLQYAMSMVGTVVVRDFGITLNPVMHEKVEITYAEALDISLKIASFEDEICVLKDAMPRSKDGNADVMGTALIAGYVRSLKRVEHVASTYVSAFLGMKIAEEQAFSALYRVQYDDIEFIRQSLISSKAVLCGTTL